MPDVALVRSSSAGSMARTDSRVSDLSGMTPESTFRKRLSHPSDPFGEQCKVIVVGENVVDLLANEPAPDGFADAVNEAVMSPSVRGQWLRRMPPTSANGRYLASAVGGPLTKALAEVLIKRPMDPIAFLSEWLLNYHKQAEKAGGE